jgi:hypothetical protein
MEFLNSFRYAFLPKQNPALPLASEKEHYKIQGCKMTAWYMALARYKKIHLISNW